MKARLKAPWLQFRVIALAILPVAILAILACAVSAGAQEGGGPPREGGPFGGGQGVRGTVTNLSGSEATIKTEEGDTYKVVTGANTRIMKDRQPAKMTDVHTGDMLFVGGQVDAQAKTVGAAFVAIIDAEQVKKMRADLGKTWVAGKITAINETNITVHRVDNVDQTIAVDENTSFRKRRESITMADIKVGDQITARGQLKDGVFVAAELGVGGRGMMGGGRRGPGGPGGGNGPDQGPGGAGAAPAQDGPK